jgi:hypothetical protein
MARKDLSNAYRDESSVTGLLAVSTVDGTPVQLWADPTTHRLLIDNANSGITFYTDTVSGVINGNNKSFTVSNTISSALVLFLAGIPYQPTVDFTVSGTAITMTSAPDASLSGQPFWLLHT